MDRHQAAVKVIASQIGDFYERKKPFRIYHGSTNSTRQSQYQRDAIIHTSHLNHVLRVNTERKTALVEPNVPMDKLVAETLRHGLVPPVVMEFPGITVGGGFAGTSGESSSFRHGFFENNVNWIEIVLANGDVMTASSDENADLFYGAASSFGTLGVTTLLEVQLVDAKELVELTYHPVSSVPEAIRKFEEATIDPSIHYLDSIFFARNWGVVCTGRLTDSSQAVGIVQRFTRPKDPWFYRHTEKLLARTAAPVTEAVPLVDYLFRYDRGAFWVGRYAFKYFITPFNRITRRILDRFMHTRIMYHALHKSGLSKRYIAQDVAVPYAAADEFIQFVEDLFGFYPIWLCPLRMVGRSPFSSYTEDEISSEPARLVNFGVWGPGPSGLDSFVEANRKLEQKVHELNGMKCLYAHAYYTEEEFRNTYNCKDYDVLRVKYHATYLPSVYDKVKVDVSKEKEAIAKSWIAWLLALFWSIWPLAGLYGVFHAIRGGDYLLPPKTEASRSLQEK